MMKSLFSYGLFIVGILAVAGLIHYAFRTKKKVTLNPLNIIIGAFFFLALWMADLTTLGINDKGWNMTVGLTTELNSRIPVLFVYIICMIGLFAINIYYNFYNKKLINNNKFNKGLIYTQLFGLIIFLTMSIIYAFYTKIIWGFSALGLYHSSIPLIIISEIALMINLKY